MASCPSEMPSKILYRYYSSFREVCSLLFQVNAPYVLYTLLPFERFAPCFSFALLGPGERLGPLLFRHYSPFQAIRSLRRKYWRPFRVVCFLFLEMLYSLSSRCCSLFFKDSRLFRAVCFQFLKERGYLFFKNSYPLRAVHPFVSQNLTSLSSVLLTVAQIL